MHQKIVKGYLLFCGLFLVALIALTAVRAKTIYDRNRRDIQDRFQKLNQVGSSLFLSFRSLSSDEFLREIRSAIAGEDRLLLLSVYSAEGGIEYLYSRSQDYVNGAARVGAAWTGRPAYQNLPVGASVLSATFYQKDDVRLMIDGGYVVFGATDLFPVLKETFIVLFVFFVATCIVLILAGAEPGTDARPGALAAKAGKGGREVSRSPASAAAQPASATEDGPREYRRDTRNLFSPDTGLGWSDHLPQRLKFEIDRAAAFDQDLVLALLAVDDYRALSDRWELYVRIAKMILEEFNFQDLAFEYREGSYALILPDTELYRGTTELDLFQKKVASTKELGQPVTLTVGLSSRNGRLVDGVTLLTEASQALKRARSQGAGSLIGFQADPEKYRGMIARKS